jgi:hypothetical protein
MPSIAILCVDGEKIEIKTDLKLLLVANNEEK